MGLGIGIGTGTGTVDADVKDDLMSMSVNSLGDTVKTNSLLSLPNVNLQANLGKINRSINFVVCASHFFLFSFYFDYSSHFLNVAFFLLIYFW